MLAFARIAAVACAGAMFATLVWATDKRLDTLGPLDLADVPLGIVILSAAAIFGCFEAWRVFTERRNASLNRAAAARFGCAYTDEGPYEELHAWTSFALFRHKEAPRASHRMQGELGGRSFDVFDYEYRVTSSTTDGTSTRTHTQTVYRFPDAAIGFQRFLIQPRQRLTGLMNRLLGGGKYVEVTPAVTAGSEVAEAYGRFRQRYQINVTDDASETDDWQRLFGPPVIAWFSQNFGWSIESNGTGLVAWRSGATQVGNDRLEKLEALSELQAQMHNFDAATQGIDRVQVAVRQPNRASRYIAAVGFIVGGMIGMCLGPLLIIPVLSMAPAWLPKLPRFFPIEAVVFFGFAAAAALIGGYVGKRLARRVAAQIDSGRHDGSLQPNVADSPGKELADPVTETDLRVMIWFFAWLVAFGVFSGGFTLVLFTVPAAMRFVGDHGWLIVVSVAAAAVCMAFATSPWYFGIRCKRCRRKLHKMKTGCDPKTGNTPLRFHCETCGIIWKTHLVSGPGSSGSTFPN